MIAERNGAGTSTDASAVALQRTMLKAAHGQAPELAQAKSTHGEGN